MTSTKSRSRRPNGAATPLEVLDATLSVIAVRGYYQPTSRQWEPMVPTAFDVRAYLQGYCYTDEPRVLRAFDLATYPLDEPAEILAWARAGADQENGYRQRLARVAAGPHVAESDIAVMCSAAQAWRRHREQLRIEADKARDAAMSVHQGEKGERITRRVTVAVVINQGRHCFNYNTITRYLIKLRDEAGNVYVWPATSRAKSLPARNAHIEITATVDRHKDYQGTAQTYIKNVRWTLSS